MTKVYKKTDFLRPVNKKVKTADYLHRSIFLLGHQARWTYEDGETL